MDLWWQLHAVFGTVLIKCTWRNQWTWWMNNGIDNIDCKVDKVLNKIWLQEKLNSQFKKNFLVLVKFLILRKSALEKCFIIFLKWDIFFLKQENVFSYFKKYFKKYFSLFSLVKKFLFQENNSWNKFFFSWNKKTIFCCDI
jgi:hypothetical protein